MMAYVMILAERHFDEINGTTGLDFVGNFRCRVDCRRTFYAWFCIALVRARRVCRGAGRLFRIRLCMAVFGICARFDRADGNVADDFFKLLFTQRRKFDQNGR